MGRAYEARGELRSAIANFLRAFQIEPANTFCRNEAAPRSDRFRILFNGASSSCSQPETTMKPDVTTGRCVGSLCGPLHAPSHRRPPSGPYTTGTNQPGKRAGCESRDGEAPWPVVLSLGFLGLGQSR